MRGVYQLHAVWYALDGRHARLEVESSRVRLPPEEIVLRPGKLEAFQDELQRLSRLSVSPATASRSRSSIRKPGKGSPKRAFFMKIKV